MKNKIAYKVGAQLVLLILFLTPLLTVAQNKQVYVTGAFGTTMIETSKDYNSIIFYDSFWNFDSDFKYGILFLKNGDTIDNLGVRYNITRDRFEVVNNIKKGTFIVNPNTIKLIRRMSEEFTYSKFYNKNGKLTKGYLKIVYNSKTKLFYRKAEKHKDGESGAFGYSAFKSFEINYYLQKQEDEFPTLLKTTKKAVLQLLSDKRTTLNTFVSENNLNYNKPRDLISILTFYDSL